MPFQQGSFLIAKSSLLDPNFRQAVVLLIQHNEEGAFGLIVNRPVPFKDLPCPVFKGGPCQAQGMFLLHGREEWAEGVAGEIENQIAPGIFLGDAECAEEIKELPKDMLTHVRLFAGYAGWGPGQLEFELEGGAWAVAPADGKTLFETPAKDLWTHLRPPAIPQPSVN